MSSLRMRSHLVFPILPAVPALRTFPWLLVLPVVPGCAGFPAKLAAASTCPFRAPESGMFRARCFELVDVLDVLDLATMLYSLMEWLQNAVVQPWDGCGQGVARLWWRRGGGVGCQIGESAPGNCCAPSHPGGTTKKPQQLRL